jgi:hypothetical protein
MTMDNGGDAFVDGKAPHFINFLNLLAMMDYEERSAETETETVIIKREVQSTIRKEISENDAKLVLRHPKGIFYATAVAIAAARFLQRPPATAASGNGLLLYNGRFL